MQKNYRYIALILIVFAAASWTRRSVPAVPGNNIIKVMTYNTHHCNPPDKRGIIDAAAIAAVIKKEQPDIVALQEIDVNTRRDGHINEAAEIASKADYPSFYFAKTIDLEGGQYGIMILSKFPLAEMATYKLPTNETIGGEHRVLATAAVQLPGGKIIEFGCTHLDAEHDENRLLQIKEISRIAARSKYPFIIAGDFNSGEDSKVINILDQSFTRTCTRCKPTLHEEGYSDVPIDFIAYKPGNNFTVRTHAVLQNVSASDHYPVTAVLKMNF